MDWLGPVLCRIKARTYAVKSAAGCQKLGPGFSSKTHLDGQLLEVSHEAQHEPAPELLVYCVEPPDRILLRGKCQEQMQGQQCTQGAEQLADLGAAARPPDGLQAFARPMRPRCSKNRAN